MDVLSIRVVAPGRMARQRSNRVNGCLDWPLLLSSGETAVLRLLAARRNVIMTRDAIGAALPGLGPAVMIDVLVCRIGAKLAAAGVGSVITTVWGRGYVVQDDHDRALNDPHQTGPVHALCHI